MSITQGDHSYVGLPVNEYFDPKVTIGKFTSVAEGVVWFGKVNHVCIRHRKAVSTFNFRERWKQDYFEPVGYSKGPIIVGNDVWIGRDVYILDGITIGDGAIVGARAMVTKDVPPYAVVAGNPAVVKKYRFTKDQIEKLLKIKWWSWPDELIRDRMEDFKNIEVFVDKYYEE